MSEQIVRKLGPKERILQAAITCIEREGFERATVRVIAQEAGVNVASINYHFGSKDHLMTQVRDHTLDGALFAALGGLESLLHSGVPVEQALVEWLDGYIADAVLWPRISYAHLREALTEQDYTSSAVVKLNAFLDTLHQKVSGPLGHRDPRLGRLLLSQMWANVVLLMLMPRLMAPFLCVDLSLADQRRAYVQVLLAPLLGKQAQPNLWDIQPPEQP